MVLVGGTLEIVNFEITCPYYLVVQFQYNFTFLVWTVWLLLCKVY